MRCIVLYTDDWSFGLPTWYVLAYFPVPSNLKRMHGERVHGTLRKNTYMTIYFLAVICLKKVCSFIYLTEKSMMNLTLTCFLRTPAIFYFSKLSNS